MIPTAQRKIAAVVLAGTHLLTGGAVLGIFLSPTIAAAKDAFPKVSPFSSVRWVDSGYQVRVNNKWYDLVAINDQPIGKIIDFARGAYNDIWQKRIDEDLFEVLTAMGSRPAETVSLKLRTLQTQEVVTLKDVRMTSENRWAIWRARNQPGSSPATQPSSTTAPAGRVS